MGTINGKNNHENLTYRQLKKMVPATPKGKMPSPDKIEGKILFRAKENDAKIVIFKNGYLTYTKNDGFGDPCTTVYSVHRCNQIVYKTGCSEDEFNEECGQYGKNCKLIYRIINGQRIRFAIVSEEAYLDEPWWMPIIEICDERIDQNLNDRERRRMEPLNDDDYRFPGDEADPETWLDAVIDNEQADEQHKRLTKALEKLTTVQRNTIELFFGNEIMTERKAAQILKTTHINVHKNKLAALRKLRNEFFK